MGSVLPHRNGSVVTRSAYLSDEDDMPWACGSAGAAEESLALNEDELQQQRELRDQALARKRQPGFIPWND